MWADAKSFATYLIKFVPTEVAEPLNELLETVTRVKLEEEEEEEEEEGEETDFMIEMVRKLLAGLAFEKPVYFLNVCPAD
eukprot:scaffold99658_cov63-Phaeocystis_antarctica.AAC.1